MLIAKNNFSESQPVQSRLILSRKSEFYSVSYSDSDSEIFLGFRFRLQLWKHRTFSSDSDSDVGLV